MMSTSTREDLTDLLHFLGAVLNDPGAGLRPALLHVIGELARLLSVDIDDHELACVLGSTATPAPDDPVMPGQAIPLPGRGQAVVLAVREKGALLKVRAARRNPPPPEHARRMGGPLTRHNPCPHLEGGQPR
ncbi:hypothetical protein [Nonomuraea sp. C10]|uniref:hypothetical protein n=1 Tax=Nonomuraea sp. C10 TaxID=2600577 RepID=UPI0011CE7920|nr:hypothetical protein [Nonomuraea sp. C10]TXK41468.1 hypothetical protein FR742_19525 [Nonomuraea sp. C10]